MRNAGPGGRYGVRAVVRALALASALASALAACRGATPTLPPFPPHLPPPIVRLFLQQCTRMHVCTDVTDTIHMHAGDSLRLRAVER